MTIKYLDAKRIRGSSTQARTTTVDEDFSSVGSWVQVGSPVSIHTGNSRVQNSGYSNAAPNYYVYKDLGASFNPFDQSFVLRYKTLLGTASSQAGYWGVGWTDSTSDANSGDHWTQAICTSGSGGYIRFQDSINGSYSEVANSSTSPAPSGLASVCYVHVVFDSSTNVIRYRAYSNSDFSTGELVDLSYTLTPSNYQGMRYLFVGSVNASGRYLTGSYTTDLKLYLNTTDVTTIDEKATLGSKANLGITFDFTSATGWVTYNHDTIGSGAVTIDSSTDNRVEGVSVPQHERDRVVYDLGQAVSDTEWTLDFDMNCSAIATHRAFIPCGLSSIPDWNNSTTDDNAIGIYFNDNSGTKYFQSIVNKGGAHQSEEGTQALSLDTTYYARLKRNSDTSITISYYPNASTRTANGTPTYTDEQTITTGVIDLRYIIIGSGKYGNSPETVSFTVDNVKLVATAKNTTFDLPENTLFEETDTYKTYWLQSSLWQPIPITDAIYGLFMGGHTQNVGYTTQIDRITIDTLDSAVDFGDLNVARGWTMAVADATRGVCAGGGAYKDEIAYVTIAGSVGGTATDFGDLNENREQPGACCNATYGLFCGGYKGGGNAGVMSSVDVITIQTTGDATDWGDLSTGFMETKGASTAGVFDNSHGMLFSGSQGGVNMSNVHIDYLAISASGSGATFGDCSVVRRDPGALANETRALVCAGQGDGVYHKSIDYFTVATTGSYTDFGDITNLGKGMNGCNNSTRGVFGGGQDSPSGTYTDRCEYITIASASNATTWGDLEYAPSGAGACSGA